jgi:hypothetical protein
MKNRMNIGGIPAELEKLKGELQEVRRASLEATRLNDFRKVARLTAQAAQLNKAIIEAQGLVLQEV